MPKYCDRHEPSSLLAIGPRGRPKLTTRVQLHRHEASLQPIIYTVLPIECENDPAIIYSLDGSFNIAGCNAAWDNFALENGGGHLVRSNQIGRNVMDVTPAPLKSFYATLFGGVLDTGVEKSCLYECSSDKVFRRFHMHVARAGAPGREFLLVVNSLVLERPHDEPAFEAPYADLLEKNGLITMCSHCRRTRLPGDEERCVWIPRLVRETPGKVSHGICRICFELYYGTLSGS